MTLPENVPTFPSELPASAPPARPLTARRAIFILCAYLATQFGVGVVVLLVMAVFSPANLPEANDRVRWAQSVAIIPIAILALLLGGLVVVRLARRGSSPVAEWRASLGLIPASRTHIVAGVGAGLILGVAFLLLSGLFPPSPTRSWGPLVTAASEHGWTRYGWAIAGLLLAPPVEEFLFRGVLLEGFSHTWGPAIAGCAVVASFTALHLTETRDYWPAIVAIGAMATAATLVRLKTGSLWPAIAVHAAYNFVMVGVAFAS